MPASSYTRQFAVDRDCEPPGANQMSLANDNLITDAGIPIATQVTGVAFFLALIQWIGRDGELSDCRKTLGKDSFLKEGLKQGDWDMEEGKSWQQGN